MQVPSVLVSTPSGGAEGLDKPVWYHRQTVMLRPCLDDHDSRIGSLADVGREFSGEGRVDSVFCPWLRRQRHEENSVRRVLRLFASGKPGSLGRLIIRGWSSSKLPCIASFAQKRSLPIAGRCGVLRQHGDNSTELVRIILTNYFRAIDTVYHGGFRHNERAKVLAVEPPWDSV